MFPTRTTKETGNLPSISKEDAEAEIQRLKLYVEELEEAAKLKKRSSNVLVPCSPSPRKKQRNGSTLKSLAGKNSGTQPIAPPEVQPSVKSRQESDNANSARENLMTARPKSTLLDGLKTVRGNLKTNATVRTVPRNSSFNDPRPNSIKPTLPQQSPFFSIRTKASGSEQPPSAVADTSSRPMRDQVEIDSTSSNHSNILRASDLTVNTEIRFGPIDFKPPIGDSSFSTLEPNSNVRLKHRTLSHMDLQDHLYGRHIVRINELYGIIRKLDTGRSKGGTEWDVPLVGDWVLFGVIGEKGDFKLTNPQNSQPYLPLPSSTDPKLAHNNKTGRQSQKPTSELQDELTESLLRDEQSQQDATDAEFTNVSHRSRKQKHYVNLKLVDMSSKTISQSGSGILNMLLFEADEEIVSEAVDLNGLPIMQKTYRGGSGGAYEKFWKERPGTLIAILNPKVLKSRPYPNRPASSSLDLLSITPEKAESVMIIGRAKDLGNCTAKRLDTGKECGNWCDLRVQGGIEEDVVSRTLSICEFHLQRQISKTRAGRAEFFASTSGSNQHVGTKFDSASIRKNGYTSKSKEFDPVKKTGLLPSSTSTNGMKVVNGEKIYICPGDRPNRKDTSSKPVQRWDQPVPTEKLDTTRRVRSRVSTGIEAEGSLQVKLNGNLAKKNPSLGDQYLVEAQRLLKAKSEKQKEIEQKSSKSQSSNSRDPAKPRKNFNDKILETIGHDPTSSKDPISQQTSKVEEKACNFLDLLGEDGSINRLGPDSLKSSVAKHGTRPGVLRKKGSQTLPTRPLTAEAVSSLAKQEVATTAVPDEVDSDSDDSLIVLPP